MPGSDRRGVRCIGVGPYYLTTKAPMLGYHPQVVLAGRRINDAMGPYVARRTIKEMISAGFSVSEQPVIVLGMTFKENVPDLRNSKVISLVRELESYGAKVSIQDPIAAAEDALREYGVRLTPWDELPEVAAIVLAVGHRALGPGSDLEQGGRDVRLLPGFQGAIDKAALWLMMRFLAVPAPHCIYQGFAVLLPGSYLTIDAVTRPDRVVRLGAQAKLELDAGIVRFHLFQSRKEHDLPASCDGSDSLWQRLRRRGRGACRRADDCRPVERATP